MLTVADALVCALREYGVRYVFGVSGANIEHIHDALYRHGEDRLHSVLCKSETGAAFMADGYARQSGHIGVCCATSGGGALNLSVGVAEARASGIPVLAVVGGPPTALQGRGAFQQAEGGPHQVDGEWLWRSVAKHVATVRAGSFWSILHQTFVAMVSGHPGPAALLIARDVMAQPVAPLPADGWHGFFKRIEEGVLALAQVSTPSQLSFQGAWRDARRPVVIAGAGMAHCDDFVTWVDQQNVPVATTMEAPSVFPQTHPKYLGLVGVSGHASCHAYIERSDCVLVLGNSLDAMSRAPVEAGLQNKPVCVVHTNLQTVPDLKGLVTVEACARRWLAEQGLPGPGAHGVRSSEWDEPQPFVPQTIGSVETEGAGLGNTPAVEALQPFMSRFGAVMMDAGNCAATAAHHLRFPEQVRSQIAVGMGGMGYAVCAGIGVQLAQPDRTTLVLCGDGAMLMLGTEIHTAIELGLPILWVVFNDSQHGMCTTRQRQFFDSRIHATRYATVDFTTMVRGLAGDNPVWLGRADTQDDVTRELENYLELPTRVPGVLELRITEEEVPPFFPLMSARSPTRSQSASLSLLAS